MGKFQDFVRGELASSISPTSTTVRVVHEAPYNRFPDPETGLARAILADHLKVPTKFEIITYTGTNEVDANTTDLTGVVRGADGTTAESFDAGAPAWMDLTAANLDLLGLQLDGVPVLAGGYDTNLHKLSHTGHLEWMSDTPDDAILALDADPDGTTYLVTRDGYAQRYDPLGEMEWEFYLRDSMARLSEPIGEQPGGTVGDVAFSADDSYLAVAHGGTSKLSIYKRSGVQFTKLDDPAVLPDGSGRGVAWTADDRYLAVGHFATPFITIYKRDGDTFTKLPDPSTLPASHAAKVAFSDGGTYLAVPHADAPYLTVYKRDGDTFTKLTIADPPTGIGSAASFWGEYLAVGHDTDPHLTIYKRSGDTFNKLADPSTLPGVRVDDVAFSPNGEHLALALAGGVGVMVYRRDGDVFTKVDDPDTKGLTQSFSVAFSADSLYLAAGVGTSDQRIFFWRRDGDTFDLLPELPDPPNGLAFGLDYSSDGDLLASGHTSEPQVQIFRRETFNLGSLRALGGDGCVLSASGDISQMNRISAAGTRDWLVYVDASPAHLGVSSDQQVFVAGRGRLSRHLSDGTRLWSIDGLSAPLQSVAVRGGDVVVAEANKLSIYGRDGRRKNSFPALSNARSLVLTHDDHIHMIRDGAVVRADMSGNVVWQTGFLGFIQGLAVDQDGNTYYGRGRRVGKLDSSGNPEWLRLVASAQIIAVTCPDVRRALALFDGSQTHLGRVLYGDVPDVPDIWEGAAFHEMIEPDTPPEGKCHIWIDDDGNLKAKFDNGSVDTIATKGS